MLSVILSSANSVLNRLEFLEITCNLLKAPEKSHIQGAIGFGSYSLKSWHKIFKAITKHSNHNRVIIFDSNLKTALLNMDVSPFLFTLYFYLPC